MTYIVHGATGAQGSPVVTALTAKNHSAVAAARDISAVEGRAVAVDYSSAESLARAYDGAEGVFVHLPIAPASDQIVFAKTIGKALKTAQPGRVVFSTSGYTVDDEGDGSTGPDTMIRELKASGVSYAVVEPRLFLENLLMPAVHNPVLAEGVLRYPLREDYATSWSSHLDVADVVVQLLTNGSVSGIVSVGALPGLLGQDLADGFSAYYGRPVTFEALSPVAFGDLIIPVFGEAAATPVVDSYKHRQDQPDELITETRSAQKLLGIQPRSVEQWLRDLRV
jgi:uncharacterized protein YbjT (DUF2867 family)